MDTALLKAAAKIGNVKGVAIIDDAYDPLSGVDVDEDRYRAFRATIEDDPTIREYLTNQTGLTTEQLDDYEEFIENELLIRALSDLVIDEQEEDTKEGKAVTVVKSLFGPRRETTSQKRQQLAPLEQLLIELGLNVVLIGSDWSTEADREKLMKCEVIFLDFFLSSNLPADFDIDDAANAAERDRARAAALKMTTQIVDAFMQVGMAPPSFILVSQNALDDMAETFRQESARMMCRFRFLRKKDLRNPNLTTIYKVADIFESFQAASRIEPLVTGWKVAAENAVADVHNDILELDLREYGYLHKYRLLHEGQPLHDYLKWMFAAYLSARVSQSFGTIPWSDEDAKSLEHFGKSVLTPPRSIARMYSAIRVSTDKGFRREKGREPRSGDLFLWPSQTKRASVRKVNGGPVRIVLSPACDLLIRSDGAKPNAKSVLLLSGRLRFMSAPNTTEVQFVRVHDEDYEIEWDLREPATLAYGELVKLLRRRKDPPIWIGQLKAEYLFDLQQQFAQTTFRVGLEREPVLTTFVAGRILIRRQDKAKPRLLFAFKEKDGFAWSFVDHDRNKTRYVSFSRDFVLKLYSVLDRCAQGRTVQTKTAKKLRELLVQGDFFRRLEDPVKAKDAGRFLGVGNQLQVKNAERYLRSEETKGFDLLLFNLFSTRGS